MGMEDRLLNAMTRRAPAVMVVVGLLAAACSGGGPPAVPTATRVPTAVPTVVPTRTATPAPSAPAMEAPTRTDPATVAPSSDAIYDPAADPNRDIAAALAAASTDGKPVLLDFGADWCPDCIVLARMFDTPAFAAYLDGVHVVRIDVGVWDHNLDVAAKYGNPIAVGIPAVVLVSPAGNVLGSTTDGRLASAASMTPDQVLAVLESLDTH
jgi:thiol:disulfide interchange protein